MTFPKNIWLSNSTSKLTSNIKFGFGVTLKSKVPPTTTINFCWWKWVLDNILRHFYFSDMCCWKWRKCSWLKVISRPMRSQGFLCQPIRSQYFKGQWTLISWPWHFFPLLYSRPILLPGSFWFGLVKTGFLHKGTLFRQMSSELIFYIVSNFLNTSKNKKQLLSTFNGANDANIFFI